MKFWMIIELIDEENCISCGKSIKAGQKAFIRVWWPYREPPELEIHGAYCEDCKE